MDCQSSLLIPGIPDEASGPRELLLLFWQKKRGKLNCHLEFPTLNVSFKSIWEGGEGEMYRKSNMETYITICKIDSQQEFAVWLRRLKQGICVNLEGWDGEGGSEGRGYRYTCVIHVEV